eukprot:UN22827
MFFQVYQYSQLNFVVYPIHFERRSFSVSNVFNSHINSICFSLCCRLFS